MGSLRMGIDIGSTTAKIVVIDHQENVIFSAYRRHQTKIMKTLETLLNEAFKVLGSIKLKVMVTGSAGMGITERYDLPFVQEVVASAAVVQKIYPNVKTLIDIGGEDAKMIFFNEKSRPDIRMNGSCAGGTGAFIDEMASLLNVDVATLNDLANKHTNIYPMASRCAVFAKTDLQSLLSRNIQKTDIAASVFHAIVLQTVATLSRGNQVKPLVLFTGGPLTFLPALKAAFIKGMHLTNEDVLEVPHSEFITCLGAAVAIDKPVYASIVKTFTLDALLEVFQKEHILGFTDQDRLPPLFTDTKSIGTNGYDNIRLENRIERISIKDLENGKNIENNLFLGVDSGSTTSKIVLIDEKGRIIFDYYQSNQGDTINSVREGLQELLQQFNLKNIPLNIARSMVTGYGEDLIRSAFNFDEGIVETLAHFQAAKAFDSEVSFIMDIGGQDMKAIFVENGQIQNIEINEACSSGCGSFIDNFARSLGYTVQKFAQKACEAQQPCDLGARCTVFMNSRVKQALRENAKIEDISAGLAYSVIKNALHKVLKITDIKQLGEHIVVQGGTFRNPAIRQAMEKILGHQVICSNISELMGAYGAALTARDHFIDKKTSQKDPNSKNGLDAQHLSKFSIEHLPVLEEDKGYSKKEIICKGCENQCTVSQIKFPNGNVYYSGNRCENIFNNSGKTEKIRKGRNLAAIKYNMIFNRATSPHKKPLLTVGIPRVLNMYENYPFWNSLFIKSNINIRLSSPSSNVILQKGTSYIMSENLCFPAKLVSGHIIELLENSYQKKEKIDRLFYPRVYFENREFTDANNTYNCPVVTGYPEVIRSAIDPEKNHGIPLDMPEINFEDKKLLKKVCTRYLSEIGVESSTIKRAFKFAYKTQCEFKEKLRITAQEILTQARESNRHVILLLSRPYHIDRLINHKVPDMITNFGLDLITEDAVLIKDGTNLDNTHIMSQWTYINRYFHAAKWAREQANLSVVQLNSFGCGPDPFILDEIKTILGEYHKYPLVIRIDEIESSGSIKLRLRSMVESIKQSTWGNLKYLNSQEEKSSHKNLIKEENSNLRIYTPRKTTKIFRKEDSDRIFIAPDFSRFFSPGLIRPIIEMGYTVVCLPPADQDSVDVGLKYTNNELCYPAIVCIGDIIKALLSGEYDLTKTAVIFVQTGGPCRATSYTSMIKKAMIAAGLSNIPVVAISTALNSLNEQPGFKINILEYLYRAALGMLYCNTISEMYHAMVIREKNSGVSENLADKYLSTFMSGEVHCKSTSLMVSLKEAIKEFNKIETIESVSADSLTTPYPKVGIVGEIYVKYNEFSNNDIVQWLIEHKIEVIMPNMIQFFALGFLGKLNEIETGIKRKNMKYYFFNIGIKFLRYISKKVEQAMENFHYGITHFDINDIASWGSEILSLNQNFGEGWMVAAEISALMRHGIKNVLCLQPFGCIANHVVAKGVQKRLKAKFPDLNLLFLDLDAGISKVNFFNRLHFFINHTHESIN